MQTPARHWAAKNRLTRLAAAMAGFGLTAVAAWTLSAGLTDPPEEVFSRSSMIELALPYQGFCRGVSVQQGEQQLSLASEDIRAGLARLAFPLPPGQHELTLCFDTPVPGLQRNYPLRVVVDQTPPPLQLVDHPLWRSESAATVAETLPIEGTVEPGARLFVGDRELQLSLAGEVSTQWPLAPGWNYLWLRAEDKAGNQTRRKLSLFRDVEAPEVTWRTPPGHVFSQNTARLELSIHDDGELSGVTSTVDGKPIVWHRKSAEDWLGVTPPLPEGRHQVELRVADQAGRVTTSKREILIDSTEVLGEAVLALGARGEDVSQLHQRLLEAGYLVSHPGSIFGAVTRQALESLQADQGFAITGRADGPTLTALGPRLVINLARFELLLERPGQPVRRWSIASGSAEYPTPIGRFVVYEKVVDPTWLPPDSEWAKDAKPVEPGPDNPLGTRWIGLDWGGVGIHGTNAPWTVGSAASHGCMRMETSQVEELFELVEVGTPVVVLGGWEDDPLRKKFWP
jgi:hypothetical protein